MTQVIASEGGFVDVDEDFGQAACVSFGWIGNGNPEDSLA